MDSNLAVPQPACVRNAIFFGVDKFISLPFPFPLPDVTAAFGIAFLTHLYFMISANRGVQSPLITGGKCVCKL